MFKLFVYECRRLLGGKAFLGIAVATLWYAHQMLWDTVIWGVADTAPFSPWSFGYYLTVLLPFLCGAGLLLLAGSSTRSAQQTMALVQASPMPAWQYGLVRCGTVALGLGLLCLCVTGMGLLFLNTLFGSISLDGFGQVAVWSLLPLPMLVLGLGTVLSRWGAPPLYGLTALLFLLTQRDTGWDLWGRSFFQDHPVTLGILDPPLQIPLPLWLGRTGILLAGLALLGASAYSGQRQSGRRMPSVRP